MLLQLLPHQISVRMVALLAVVVEASTPDILPTALFAAPQGVDEPLAGVPQHHRSGFPPLGPLLQLLVPSLAEKNGISQLLAAGVVAEAVLRPCRQERPCESVSPAPARGGRRGLHSHVDGGRHQNLQRIGPMPGNPAQLVKHGIQGGVGCRDPILPVVEGRELPYVVGAEEEHKEDRPLGADPALACPRLHFDPSIHLVTQVGRGRVGHDVVDNRANEAPRGFRGRERIARGPDPTAEVGGPSRGDRAFARRNRTRFVAKDDDVLGKQPNC